MNVGQCEACEAWFAAKLLIPTKVTKPCITTRLRMKETCDSGIPGLENDQVAFFCPECIAAMKDDKETTGAPRIEDEPTPVQAKQEMPESKK